MYCAEPQITHNYYPITFVDRGDGYTICAENEYHDGEHNIMISSPQGITYITLYEPFKPWVPLPETSWDSPDNQTSEPANIIIESTQQIPFLYDHNPNQIVQDLLNVVNAHSNSSETPLAVITHITSIMPGDIWSIDSSPKELLTTYVDTFLSYPDINVVENQKAIVHLRVGISFIEFLHSKSEVLPEKVVNLMYWKNVRKLIDE